MFLSKDQGIFTSYDADGKSANAHVSRVFHRYTNKDVQVNYLQAWNVKYRVTIQGRWFDHRRHRVYLTYA